MDSRLPPTFRIAAMASGLLTAEQLREVENAVRADQNAGEVKIKISEPQLIEKVIELGLLNPWQVEQLKLGRTKFTLGNYLVIDSIGQGGMGQVFKAVHSMMGRVVAIKVLPRHKSTPAAIASFTREIRAQAQMDHDHLVRAFDAGHDGNVYFLVTEYVPGTDLRKFVRARQKLTMNEAATIISQAARGLSYAHGRGMIHRDVKPGNLLVTPEGHTKVSDLGLAGFLSESESDDPLSGKIVGTADYLAPELITSPQAISPAVDIYALGCTLYYAVTGKVPFPGGSAREKAMRHLESTPLRPNRINPDLSDEFVDVIAAMMEKDPGKRIATAMEVVERMAPWAHDAVENAVSDAEQNPGPPDLAARSAQLPDTSDGFGFGEEGELSEEISQGTDASATSSQDTVPNVPRRRANSPPAQVPASVAMLVLGPIVLVSALLFLLMLVWALR